MAFAIEISEVGPGEFPLMEVLRETVFSEFGFVSRNPVSIILADSRDLLMLLAHLEGNPVGFAAGRRRTPHAFYVNLMAVLPDYRRQGIGKQFMARQESFARARGYERIEFNTQNRFPGMMRLGVSLGYRPVGLEQHDGTLNDLVIRFGKSLQRENPVDASLLAALTGSDEIVGLRRDADGRLHTLLRSEMR